MQYNALSQKNVSSKGEQFDMLIHSMLGMGVGEKSKLEIFCSHFKFPIKIAICFRDLSSIYIVSF